MENWIAGAVLLIVIIVAIVYVIRAKKNGKKCIGCPNASCCPSKNRQTADGSCCSCCGCAENNNESSVE